MHGPLRRRALMTTMCADGEPRDPLAAGARVVMPSKPSCLMEAAAEVRALCIDYLGQRAAISHTVYVSHNERKGDRVFRIYCRTQ